MRKIFATKKAEFVESVKGFELGRNPDPEDKILSFISKENYAPKRKIAVGETDFVQVVIQDIVPALHCLHFLKEAKNYIDVEEEFASPVEKDNLLWVLFFLVQVARTHSQPSCTDPRPRCDHVARTTEELIDYPR